MVEGPEGGELTPELLQQGYGLVHYPADASAAARLRVVGVPRVKPSFRVKYDSCEVEVDNADGGRIPDVQDRIELYENGILVFHGLTVSVPKFTQTADGVTARILAASMPYLLWKKLSRRWVFTGQDDLNVLQSLMLERHNNNLDLSLPLGNVFQSSGDVELSQGRLQLKHATSSTFETPGFAVAAEEEIVTDINKATVFGTAYAQRSRTRDLLFNLAGTPAATPWLQGGSDFDVPPSTVEHDAPTTRVRVPDRVETQDEYFDSGSVLDVGGHDVVVAEGALKLSGTIEDESFEAGYGASVADLWRATRYTDSVQHIFSDPQFTLTRAPALYGGAVLIIPVGSVGVGWAFFTYDIAARTFSVYTTSVDIGINLRVFNWRGATYGATGAGAPSFVKFSGVHPNIVAASTNDIDATGLPAVGSFFTYGGTLYCWDITGAGTLYAYDDLATSWATPSPLPSFVSGLGVVLPPHGFQEVFSTDSGGLAAMIPSFDASASARVYLFDGYTWAFSHALANAPGTAFSASAYAGANFIVVSNHFTGNGNPLAMTSAIECHRSLEDLELVGVGQGVKSLHVYPGASPPTVPNPDFEAWAVTPGPPDGWSSSIPAGITKETVIVHTGLNSAAIASGISMYAPLLPNNVWGVIGVWAKASAPGLNMALRIGGGANHAFNNISTDWTFYSIAGQSTVAFPDFTISNTGGIGTIYFDTIQFIPNQTVASGASGASPLGTVVCQFYPIATTAAFTIAEAAYKFRVIGTTTLQWQDASGAWTSFPQALGVAQWSELKFEVDDSSADPANWRCRVWIRGFDQGQITPQNLGSSGLLSTPIAGDYSADTDEWYLDGIIVWPNIGVSNPLLGQGILKKRVTAENVQRAYLMRVDNKPAGASILYEVSADDGNTWRTMTPTTDALNPVWTYWPTGFGVDVKVRISLSAANQNNLPSVSSYNLVLGAGYEVAGPFTMHSKDFGDDDTIGATIRIESEGTGTDTSTPNNTTLTYEVSSNDGANWSAHPGPGNTVTIPPAERGNAIRVRATLDTNDAEVTSSIMALRITWSDAAAATTLTISISRDGGATFHNVALGQQFDFAPYPSESPKNEWVIRFDLSTTDTATTPTIEDVSYTLILGNLPYIQLGKIGVQAIAVLAPPDTYPATLTYTPLGPVIERLVRDMAAVAFWVLNPSTKTYTLHYNSLEAPSATFTGRAGVEVLEVDGRIDGQNAADRWAFGGGT